MVVLEKHIKNSILDYLRLQYPKGSWHIFENTRTWSHKNKCYLKNTRKVKGVSDIIGCSPRGMFVAIEVKRPGQKPTKEQSQFLDQINKTRSGLGFVATCLYDVKTTFRKNKIGKRVKGES